MAVIPRRHGFSLLELIIAMALGLVLISVVYAGFRVAAQSVTVTERLALENRLLIGGVVLSLDEVDHWTSLDHPTITTRQLLRTSGPFKSIGAQNGGYAGDGSDWAQLPQPFTPLSAGWPTSGVSLTDSGTYDPVWLANDPATWYRGDGAFHTNSRSDADASPFGNYALFAAVGGAAVAVGPSGSATQPTSQNWLPRQQRGLKYCLGFYGWFSYVPANTLLDWYEISDTNGPHAVRPNDLWPQWVFTSAQAASPNQGRFTLQGGSGSGNLQTGAERGATRAFWLYSNQVAIAAPSPGATPDEQRRRCVINRQMSTSFTPGGSDEAVSTYPLVLAQLDPGQALIASGPSHWPTVTYGVRRTMKWGMIINLCTVRSVDPVSGQMTELRFPATGTTLRGARWARGLDQ